MPTMTAHRPTDTDEINSYADIVAAHADLSRKVAAGKGEIHQQAARRVVRLGELYQVPAEITNAVRAATQTAFAAIRAAVRAGQNKPARDLFDAADSWLDQLSLLVHAPTDGR